MVIRSSIYSYNLCFRECLSLFPTPTGAVQYELNLIASLSLLDDFGVSILPLQVRIIAIYILSVPNALLLHVHVRMYSVNIILTNM